LFSDEGLPDSIAPAELGIMLANGITTARLMIGTREHLKLRAAIASSSLLGPQLWVSSPQFAGRAFPNGIKVSTPDEARIAVRQVADSGYDAVKLTLFITRPVYDAVIDEAAKRNIRVVGHVDTQVGIARALQTGQQLEHLDSYFEAVLADHSPIKTSLTQQFVFQLKNWASLDYMDDRKIDSIAGATARAGAWITPTLNIFNHAFAAYETDQEIRSRPDWEMFPPQWREQYLGYRARYWHDTSRVERTEARRRRYVEVRNRLVKVIQDSGGRIMAGSDTPEWFHLYGFALHRELQALVEAGLTPYQALAAATRNPAGFLGQLREWGTVETGKRADLVLLSANPLEDIRRTNQIEAVVVGGRWLGPDDLKRLIAEGKAALRGTAAAR
jgi:imidazolonepropionase-like amidohydrolase